MIRITNIPDGEKVSKDFKIKLNGKDVFAYVARVSAMPFNCVWPGHQRPIEQTEEAPVLSFAMDEDVLVELWAEREFDDVVVRPLSDVVVPNVDGRRISFTIKKAGQYTVELDGFNKALHIFANPNIDFGVAPYDDNVIYFGAGVHNVGRIDVESNQTVYIDQDAFVYGNIVSMDATNIRVLGYGVLDGSREERTDYTALVPKDINRRSPEADVYSPCFRGLPVDEVVFPIKGSTVFKNKEQFDKYLEDLNLCFGCVQLYNCTNCEVNGVVLRDSVGFTMIVANCENVICDNVKLVGMWKYNSDGIDLFNSKNCTIRNSFLRNFDDCVVLKGIPGWDEWNMENILVENCVTWCDWGRALEIGAETNAPEYRNIIFRNCDCIHNAHVAIDIQNCDRAHIHDVLYDDIRVEYSKYDLNCDIQRSDDKVYEKRHSVPDLIVARICDTSYSHVYCKGNVSDIRYENIKIITDNESEVPGISFRGIDAEHIVKNVKISGLTMNGKPINDDSLIYKNEFASDIELV